MRWKNRRRSDNVEDRRGQGGGFRFPFPMPGGRGGGMRFPIPGGGGKGGGFGLVGVLIILGIMLFFPELGKIIISGGVPGGGGGGFPQIEMPKLPDTMSPRSGTGSQQSPFPRRGGTQAGTPRTRGDSNDELAKFTSVVLADTEDVWNTMFQQMGRRYQEPKLVLFSGFTQSGCGMGMRQMGPFYCPLDNKVYIDLAFYREMKSKFGAGGDFAHAYVVAHEIGHHVQTLLGIADKVQRAKARVSTKKANAIQVRMELQADCFAGVWARHAHKTKNILEEGDIEEAMNAASAIGDDKIMKRTQGYVVPDAFTHGSSRQRVRWFTDGFKSGSLSSCDTFNTRNP